MKALRTTAVLLTSAILALSVVSCSSEKDNDDDAGERTDAESVEEQENVDPADTEGEAADPTVTVTPGIAPANAGTVPYFPDDYLVNQDYDILMNFIEEKNAEDGSYTFSIAESYDANARAWYWGIWVIEPDGSAVEYRNIDGVAAESGQSIDFWYGDSYDYDTISRVPVLFDTQTSSCNVVDSLKDGLYIGSLIGVSIDCSYVVANIGSAIYRSADELAGLEPGDVVSFPELDLELTIDTIDGDYISFTDSWYYLVLHQAQRFSDRAIYALCEAGDCPVGYDYRLAVLPVADNCVVNDTFSILTGRDKVDPSLSQGNSLSESYYWTYLISDDAPDMIYYRAALSNNGYVYAYGLTYPLELSDGRVVRLCLEWR